MCIRDSCFSICYCLCKALKILWFYTCAHYLRWLYNVLKHNYYKVPTIELFKID